MAYLFLVRPSDARVCHARVSPLQARCAATEGAKHTNEALVLGWALESVMGWKLGLATRVVLGVVPVSLAKARGR